MRMVSSAEGLTHERWINMDWYFPISRLAVSRKKMLPMRTRGIKTLSLSFLPRRSTSDLRLGDKKRTDKLSGRCLSKLAYVSFRQKRLNASFDWLVNPVHHVWWLLSRETKTRRNFPLFPPSDLCTHSGEMRNVAFFCHLSLRRTRLEESKKRGTTTTRKTLFCCSSSSSLLKRRPPQTHSSPNSSVAGLTSWQNGFDKKTK